jgi:hypothetical protein
MDLPVIGADIRNAYLQAPSSEKHYIICGPEFGIENEGCVGIIRCALYGGKVAGQDFWQHLRNCMGHLGFSSLRGDPDVWMRLSKRTSTGEAYYEYVLLYVDDVLVISERAEKVLRTEIGNTSFFKRNQLVSQLTILVGNYEKLLLIMELRPGHLAHANMFKLL